MKSPSTLKQLGVIAFMTVSSVLQAKPVEAGQMTVDVREDFTTSFQIETDIDGIDATRMAFEEVFDDGGGEKEDKKDRKTRMRNKRVSVNEAVKSQRRFARKDRRNMFNHAHESVRSAKESHRYMRRQMGALAKVREFFNETFNSRYGKSMKFGPQRHKIKRYNRSGR